MDKLTIKQVAAIYGVKPRTVHYWIARKLISAEKIMTPAGEYTAISASTLQTFVRPKRGRSKLTLEQKIERLRSREQAEAS